MNENRYIKLFNQGYTLAKHEPKILDKLIDLTKNNDAIREPLMAGELQFKKELTQAKLQGNIGQKPRQRNRGKDIEQEM